MQPGGFKPTNLETIANGAVPELFGHELEAVMANIDDPNTDATATRSITIEVKLKPDASRQAIATSVAVKSKLAGFRPHESTIFAVREQGKLKPYDRNVNQGDLFNRGNVTLISDARKE